MAVDGRVDDREDSLFHIAAGGMAAIALGGALTPLRDVTTASNLAFAFVILTIAVGELGGRAAAISTALISALSLDFFLTKPYLRLAITEKDDLIAFFGLAACGLVAAAFASRRGRRNTALKAALRDLDLLHSAVRRLEAPPPAEGDLARLLEGCRTALPLAALVARDSRGYVLAATEGAHGKDAPALALEPDTLLAASSAGDVRRGTMPLPAEGGRIPLIVRGQPVGWLDVWGNGALADTEARRTLNAVGRVMAALVAEAPGSRTP